VASLFTIPTSIGANRGMDLSDRATAAYVPDPRGGLTETRHADAGYLALDKIAATAAFGYAGQQRIIEEMRAKSLFFVGGVPKSGTTWLQILLNAHPEVSCAGEGHFLTCLAPLLGGAIAEYNATIRQKNREVLQQFAGFPEFADDGIGFLFVSAALLLMAASGKARRVRVVGEKTPDNLTNPWFLADHFPLAKFIHILRDPRDCTVSAWFHNQRINPDEAREKFPTLSTFVPHVAQAWSDTVSDWERFAEDAPTRCAVVRYEDLVADPYAETARLFEFLRVSTRPAAIRDCIAAGDFTRLTGGRPPGVEDRFSLLRRGLPGDWRNHLSRDEDLMCQCIAGSVMRQFGYMI
jgi:Sulfotransferase family